MKIKKSYRAVFSKWIFVNWKVKKHDKYWISGANNYLKPIKLYINQIGFPMRIFCRKLIERMLSSSKDICEKLKKKNFKGFEYRNFLKFDVQNDCKQKFLIISIFSESFIKLETIVCKT